MKKYSTILLLGLFTLAACEKEQVKTTEDINVTEPVVTVSSFRATMDGSNETKTYLSEEGKGYSVLWEANDDYLEDVPITNGEKVYWYVPDEGSSNSTTATLVVNEEFGQEIPESDYYFAWYPQDIKLNSLSDSGGDGLPLYKEDNLVTLPSKRYYEDGVLYDFPMMAVSNNASLSFKNLCGIIRLNLKESELTDFKVFSIELSSSNLSMSGSFKINPKATDSESLVNSLSSAESEPQPVTLMVGYEDEEAGSKGTDVELSSETATPFMVVVPPGEYEGLSITLNGFDDAWLEVSKTFTLKAGKTVKVERSMITDINLTADIRQSESKLGYGSTLASSISELTGGKENVKKVVFEVNSKTKSSTTVNKNTTGTAQAYASFDESTGAVTISTVAKEYSIESMGSMFDGFSKLVSIEGFENINTDGCEGYANMFYNCSSLMSVDVSNLVVEGRSLANMFYGCASLTSIDMSAWSGTPKVMTNMFYNCSKLGTITLGENLVIASAYGGMFFGVASELSSCYITCSAAAKEAFLAASSTYNNYRESRLGNGASKNVNIYINGTQIAKSSY